VSAHQDEHLPCAEAAHSMQHSPAVALVITTCKLERWNSVPVLVGKEHLSGSAIVPPSTIAETKSWARICLVIMCVATDPRGRSILIAEATNMWIRYYTTAELGFCLCAYSCLHGLRCKSGRFTQQIQSGMRLSDFETSCLHGYRARCVLPALWGGATKPTWMRRTVVV
jgi:hypothetical protein